MNWQATLQGIVDTVSNHDPTHAFLFLNYFFFFFKHIYLPSMFIAISYDLVTIIQGGNKYFN